ncbi:IclR family transcriptional regulator [Methylophaga sulfidovorans]|uniref:Transcriptional regulator, IclR family n=1 Tax=Methylophaga sulfidovorans TaxID=45496 RepID=A0A1I3X397_9GAMM|nr:IclR family transcriptional regulator [Methylophaga sulfidovorans]SFK14073.1 transcriptional regulator, IclR family [Methylophaga sulfidovorans]
MIDEIKQNHSQVISRTAAILKALQFFPDGVSVDALAAHIALPRLTVQHLVSLLEQEAFVIHTHRGVQLGPALLQMLHTTHTDFVSAVRPHLVTLAKHTRETVDLCVFRGRHSLSIEHISSEQELRVVSSIGTAFSVYTSAHGKAILATLSNEEVRTIIEDKWIQQTEASHISYDTLFQDLDLIRKNGWSVDIEEHTEGVCAVGVVILDPETTERYSIAVSLPTIRFNRNMTEVTSALLQCKAEIEEVLKR